MSWDHRYVDGLVSSPNLFQARLTLIDATTPALTPYRGTRIVVNEQQRDVPSTGIQTPTSGRTLDATGGDSGSSMQVSTLYNMYISDTGATTFPGTMRGSTFGPVLCDDGVYRLDSTGNAAHWLWVGAVYLDAAGNILDVNGTRHIASYFNPQLTRCHLDIGFNNDNAATTFTLNSATFAPVLGSGVVGGGDTLSIVDLGVHHTTIGWHCLISSAVGASNHIGIGLGSITTITACQAFPALASPEGLYCGFSWRGATIGTTSLQLYIACGRSAGAANIVFSADVARNGSANDPPGQILHALTML